MNEIQILKELNYLLEEDKLSQEILDKLEIGLDIEEIIDVSLMVNDGDFIFGINFENDCVHNIYYISVEIAKKILKEIGIDTEEIKMTHIYLDDYEEDKVIYSVSLLPENVEEDLIGHGFKFERKFYSKEEAEEYADRIEKILKISFREE